MQKLPPAFAALQTVQQFIVYILVPSETRPGKTDKIPLHYRTGKKINPVDPKSWTDFDTASAAAARLGNNHGVGFVFTEQDPFWFLDIDDCLTEQGWSPLALELAAMLPNAAMEVSSSGRGLHIFGTGQAPAHTCKNELLNLEFYTAKRFVALTGNSAMGDIRTDCSAALPWLVANYFPPSAVHGSIEWTDGPCVAWRGPTDDTVLLDRMLRSQSANKRFGNGASVADLWENNTEIFEKVYPDLNRANPFNASSVDAALAQHLAFWTGNDCERMLRLIVQSKLERPKWERPDYLRRTILSACAKQVEWLADKPPEERTKTTLGPTSVTGSTFLTIPQQIDFFAGCVYVCDAHKVLVPGGVLLKPDQFRTMYGGFSFPMDPNNERVSRNAWEAFTESQANRFDKADGSTFRPDREPAQLIEDNGRTLANLWWPIQTGRTAGDVTPFLQHLAIMLPDPRDQLILLCYMAACVQFKGVKFQWAPLIQGVEGNGKTLLTRCVAYAIGDKYSHFPSAAEITEKYNDWLYGTIFIGVEDIFVPDQKTEVIEILKPMITSPRLEIRAMYEGKKMRDICCNFILNSNHKSGIRKTRNDRRFAPFFTAQQTAADLTRDNLTGDYFSDLYNWLNKGGYAIVSEFLHTYVIADEFNPATKCQRAPITSSTEDAIAQSVGTVEQEVLEAIEQGQIGFKNGWISSMALDRLLDRINASRRIPHNKRRELLQSIGYDWHPALTEGRVNNVILPDGGKPRLFLLNVHPARSLTTVAEITKAYTAAQTDQP